MVSVLLVTLLAAFAAGTVRPASAQEADVPICVVANLPDSTAADRQLETLRRIFLIRQRFWPSGTTAHPVNLPAASPIRERFSLDVFGQTVKEMAPYWNDRYFHGTRPPPTVASQQAVILFVERTEGGVGYVEEPRTRDLPPGVEKLLCLPTDSSVAAPDGVPGRGIGQAGSPGPASPSAAVKTGSTAPSSTSSSSTSTTSALRSPRRRRASSGSKLRVALDP